MREHEHTRGTWWKSHVKNDSSPFRTLASYMRHQYYGLCEQNNRIYLVTDEADTAVDQRCQMGSDELGMSLKQFSQSKNSIYSSSVH